MGNGQMNFLNLQAAHSFNFGIVWNSSVWTSICKINMESNLTQFFFQVNSQNPYMEEYVGEPYCYTIDVNNEQLLRATLKKIKYSKVDSKAVVRKCSSK